MTKEYRIEKQKANGEKMEVYGTRTVITDDIAKEVDSFTDKKTDRVIVTITRQHVDESEMK